MQNRDNQILLQANVFAEGLLLRFNGSLPALLAFVALDLVAALARLHHISLAIVARHGLNLLAIHSQKAGYLVWRTCAASAVQFSAPVAVPAVIGAFLFTI
ncbi:MAG: hypothetical protein ABSH32_09340 [Bryobacteraceae bacterium]|jgi:hypothetical protein